MSNGITVKIIGDSGPFSRMGKSIGYMITIGDTSFLLDCGGPLFQHIGGHSLKYIKGLILTHCHDDHKRWFSDFALFNMYAPDISYKVLLLTSEDVYHELNNSSASALNRSLSSDSKRIVDISHEDFVDYQPLGPLPKYIIKSIDEGSGKTSLCISDREGNIIGPDKAKIIINNKTRRPRMLLKDPVYNEWVEPESFYPFKSTHFYEENSNIYHNEGSFSIEAIKSPVWHGIPGIGAKIKTDSETLIFSSDTVNNKDLWEELYRDKLNQKTNMSKKEFESARFIYGDINDYIERMWSKERYMEAINSFNDAAVVHDISTNNNVVHTNYEKLERSVLKKDMVMLTHSPDKITSDWILSNTEKEIMVNKNRFYEIVDDKTFPFNADIYHKDNGGYYVGYKNEKGSYNVYEKNKLLNISRQEDPELGRHLYKIDLYEDISGKYFPKLEDEDSIYFVRKDGKIELIKTTKDGSIGKIIDNHRDTLLKR